MSEGPSVERIDAAYVALGSGDQAQIDEYWDPDMRWCVPGNHVLAGWYEGRDAFLDFMNKTAALSGNSFTMNRLVFLMNDEWSADVTHNVGQRAGSDSSSDSPYDHLDIDVIHLLRWRDGKVIEGRGAIFGDGTSRFNMFWSQLRPDATRIDQ